jgi:phosphomethylpyrimidine synthase
MIVGNNLGNVSLEVGEGSTTKINFIVGTNKVDEDSVRYEMRKIDLAVKLGVHTITDLSTVRLDKPLWRYVKEKYPHIGVGMNPIYLPFIENKTKVSPDTLLGEIERFILGGGDHMTINFTPKTREELEAYSSGRLIPITGRQGGLLAVTMRKHKVDNPYYPILDDVVGLAKKYNITIHIGSTFRAAGIVEANDRSHLWEVRKQMEMYSFLKESGVLSIVEVMSHYPFHMIAKMIANIRDAYGDYVPFQLLGPVVTDVCGSYDYISAAIGAAEAARFDVGKITTIPANEHKGFPTLDDAEKGIMSAKIAIHSGDMARIPDLIEEDRRVLQKRSLIKSCDPEAFSRGCDKCGVYCPLVITQRRSSKR